MIFAQGKEVVIWDVSNDVQVERWEPKVPGATVARTLDGLHPRYCFSHIDLSSDGDLIALACSAPIAYAQRGPQRVIVLDRETKEQRFAFDSGGRHGSVQFSPRGDRLAISIRGGSGYPSETRLYRTADWSLEDVLPDASVSRFSPNGKLLAVSGRFSNPNNESHFVRLHEVGDWSRKTELAEVSDRTIGLRFDDRSRSLVTAGWDRTIRVYDVHAEREVLKLSTGLPWPLCMDFGPEERRIVFGNKTTMSKTSNLGGVFLESTLPSIWNDPEQACRRMIEESQRVTTAEQRHSLYRSALPHLETLRQFAEANRSNPEVEFILAESLHLAGRQAESAATVRRAEGRLSNDQRLRETPLLAGQYADAISNRLGDSLAWRNLSLGSDRDRPDDTTSSPLILSGESLDVELVVAPSEGQVKGLRLEVLPTLPCRDEHQRFTIEQASVLLKLPPDESNVQAETDSDFERAIELIPHAASLESQLRRSQTEPSGGDEASGSAAAAWICPDTRQGAQWVVFASKEPIDLRQGGVLRLRLGMDSGDRRLQASVSDAELPSVWRINHLADGLGDGSNYLTLATAALVAGDLELARRSLRLVEPSPKNEMTGYLLDALVDRASGDPDTAKAKLSDAQTPRIQWVNERERNLLSYAIETIDGVSTSQADELADALVNKQRQSFVLLADVDQVAAEREIARDPRALVQYVLAACDASSETNNGEGWDADPLASLKAYRRLIELGFDGYGLNRYRDPECWLQWSRFAIEHFRGRGWEGSADEAALVLTHAKNDPLLIRFALPLLLLDGQSQRYREVCRSLLENPDYATSATFPIQFHLIQPILDSTTLSLVTLAPDAVQDSDGLMQRIDTLLSQHAWLGSGLIRERGLIRVGRYDEAIHSLQDKLKTEQQDDYPEDKILIELHLAIAHLWSGDTRAGGEFLRVADAAWKEVNRIEIRPVDSLRIEVLKAEAEQLISEAATD